MRSMGSVTRLHRRLLNYLFVGKFYGLWIMSWQIGNILGVDSVRRLWSETPKFLITRPFVLLITRLGDDFKRHTMQKWWTKNKGLATKKLHNKNDVKIYLINYLPKSAILLHPVPPPPTQRLFGPALSAASGEAFQSFSSAFDTRCSRQSRPESRWIDSGFSMDFDQLFN